MGNRALREYFPDCDVARISSYRTSVHTCLASSDNAFHIAFILSFAKARVSAEAQVSFAVVVMSSMLSVKSCVMVYRVCFFKRSDRALQETCQRYVVSAPRCGE